MTSAIHYYYIGPTITLPLLCRPRLVAPLHQWKSRFTRHGKTTWPRTTTALDDVTCLRCRAALERLLPIDMHAQLCAVVRQWLHPDDISYGTARQLSALVEEIQHDWTYANRHWLPRTPPSTRSAETASHAEGGARLRP